MPAFDQLGASVGPTIEFVVHADSRFRRPSQRLDGPFLNTSRENFKKKTRWIYTFFPYSFIRWCARQGASADGREWRATLLTADTTMGIIIVVTLQLRSHMRVRQSRTGKAPRAIWRIEIWARRHRIYRQRNSALGHRKRSPDCRDWARARKDL